MDKVIIYYHFKISEYEPRGYNLIDAVVL